jgi:hypothetical protein
MLIRSPYRRGRAASPVSRWGHFRGRAGPAEVGERAEETLADLQVRASRRRSIGSGIDVFDGSLKHALGWILLAPSFHPDVNCSVIGPDAVTLAGTRYPPIRRREKAREPIGIARGFINKFSFWVCYGSDLSRRAIMKC